MPLPPAYHCGLCGPGPPSLAPYLVFGAVIHTEHAGRSAAEAVALGAEVAAVARLAEQLLLPLRDVRRVHQLVAGR